MYTRIQAEARLERLRAEFMALHEKVNRDIDMTNGDEQRAWQLRDEIEILKAHLARLDRFAPLLARCGRAQ